jgi:tetraacyldisaccharide 4'-kinase
MRLIYKILSLPFQISNLIIDFLYRIGLKSSSRVAVPVISIGNISFGGEGKTPVVVSLAKFFIQKGIKPAILIRGYKSKKELKGDIVSKEKVAKGDWEDVGDEALLIAENVPSAPVITGKNRINSAYKAIEMGAKLIILDDGFQYRKIQREYDIVIVSPQPSFRREFLSSISRADAILINEDFSKEEFIKKIRKIGNDIPIFKFRTLHLGFIDRNGSKINLQGEKVIAFCGIANPLRFLESLKSLSVKPEKIIFFPDHYKFTSKDMKKIEMEAEKAGSKIALTTEKDFIRLKKLPFSIQIVYSKIEAEIEEDFYRYILERLKI